jgi:hypothetical protein
VAVSTTLGWLSLGLSNTLFTPFTSGPDLLPPEEEQERNRDQQHSGTSKNCACPGHADVLIHRTNSQRDLKVETFLNIANTLSLV